MTPEIKFPVTRLLNLVEVAALLSVSPKTIYYWVARSEIPFTRVGRHLRFDASVVVEYFKEKTLDSRVPCRSPGSLLHDPQRSLATRSVRPASSSKGV